MFDWVIWPPSQAVNFLLVPSQYRVLYVNLITVLWDVFLSYIKHKPDEVEEVPQSEEIIKTAPQL